MIVQDIITDVRAKTGDSVQPYQWLDKYFYTPINNGVRDIAAIHPEALYVTTVETDLPPDVDDPTDTILIIEIYRNDLIDNVINQLRLEDKRRRAQSQPTPQTVQPVQQESQII